VLFNVSATRSNYRERPREDTGLAEHADRSADFSPQDRAHAEAQGTDTGVPPDREARRTEVRAPSEPDETRVNSSSKSKIAASAFPRTNRNGLRRLLPGERAEHAQVWRHGPGLTITSV